MNKKFFLLYLSMNFSIHAMFRAPQWKYTPKIKNKNFQILSRNCALGKQHYKNEAMRLLRTPPIDYYLFSEMLENIAAHDNGMHEIIHELLHQAAIHYNWESNYSKILHALLVIKKTDLNSGWRLRRPLHRASELDLYNCVKVLLDHKANANSEEPFGDKYPLHYAKSPGVAQLLIAHKANVNKQDDNGNTPLHLAPFALVNLLLENRTNTELKNKEIFTCMSSEEYTPYEHRSDTIRYKFLLKIEKLIREDIRNIEIVRGSGTSVKYIYSGLTPLQKATVYGDREKCQKLMNHDSSQQEIKTACIIAQIQEYRTGNPIYNDIRLLYEKFPHILVEPKFSGYPFFI